MGEQTIGLLPHTFSEGGDYGPLVPKDGAVNDAIIMHVYILF